MHEMEFLQIRHAEARIFFLRKKNDPFIFHAAEEEKNQKHD